MKLRIVLLALLTLVYGSTQAQPYLDFNEIYIEKGALSQNGFKDLQQVVDHVNRLNDANRKTPRAWNPGREEKLWRSFTRFLKRNNVFAITRGKKLLLINNDHKANLHIDNPIVLITDQGVGFEQNTNPGRFSESSRIRKNVKHHNNCLNKGILTDITGSTNTLLDIRVRGFKNISSKDLFKKCAREGINRFQFDGNSDVLNITTEFKNDNSSAILDEDIYNSDLSDDEDIYRSDLSDDEYITKNILGDSYEEDFVETNNNNNFEEEVVETEDTSLDDSGFFLETEESGFFDENGQWVPNDNCHVYFVNNHGNLYY